jgi:hypothetical protein
MPYFSLWYRASDFTGGGGGESVEVDGVLQGRRRWHAPGEAVEVDGSGAGGSDVLRVKRSWSTVCCRVGGGDVLRVKRSRSRAKRSSGIEGEAVEAMTCSGGEAVEGALRRRRRAPSVGNVVDLKRVSGENLLSVEWDAHAPDIYIGAGSTTRIHSGASLFFSGASCIIFR